MLLNGTYYSFGIYHKGYNIDFPPQLYLNQPRFGGETQTNESLGTLLREDVCHALVLVEVV